MATSVVNPYAPYNDQAQNINITAVPVTTLEQSESGIQVSKYENALPLRIDIEASMTYLLGSLTGIFFLMFEYKNDYVRFHAWQSCLVFTPMLILHALFMFSSAMQWILFVFDLSLMFFLAYKAYQHGQTLDRYEFFIFGRVASRWVDTE